MQRVLILGAGASSGTLAPLAPTAKHFGEYLSDRVESWQTNYPYLRAAVEFFESRIPGVSVASWGFDRIWGAIDNRVKLQYVFDRNLRLPNAPTSRPTCRRIYTRGLDDFGLSGFELKCAVARVYGDDLEHAFDQVIGKNGSLEKEIEKLEDGDTVVSFNYDLLAEKILGAKGKRVILADPRDPAYVTAKGVLLCKPHGSLSWRKFVPEVRLPTITPFDQPIGSHEIDYYPNPDAELQPGIIAPVPFKEEIAVWQIQGSVWSFFRLITEQWKALSARISDADEMVIMGYRFPSEDFHATQVFGDASSRRSKKLKVLIYSRSSYVSIKDTICGIFRDVAVQDCGPVCP